jgi:hypothetical protein
MKFSIIISVALLLPALLELMPTICRAVGSDIDVKNKEELGLFITLYS